MINIAQLSLLIETVIKVDTILCYNVYVYAGLLPIYFHLLYRPADNLKKNVCISNFSLTKWIPHIKTSFDVKIVLQDKKVKNIYRVVTAYPTSPATCSKANPTDFKVCDYKRM